MAGLSPLGVLGILAPLILIEFALKLVAFHDLEKEERTVRGGSKIAWALVILLVSFFGSLLYFAVGRRPD